MWGTIATKLAVWLLRSSRLSNESRQILTAALLSKLGALPIHAKITVDETGGILVDGRKLTLERAQQLKEGSEVQLRSVARKFVRETVTFLAVKQGVHENMSPEQGLFAKAALWAMQEEDNLYRLLAQTDGQ